MELKSLTGRWKGEYVLGSEYEDQEGLAFDFILDIEDTNGDLTGTCIELDMEEHFSEPIAVRGFWNKELISFVKQYPYSARFTEDGKTVVDRNEPHPEINYVGTYDKELNEFSGTFDMLEDLIPLSDGGNLEWVATGTWSMKRFEDLKVI